MTQVASFLAIYKSHQLCAVGCDVPAQHSFVLLCRLLRWGTSTAAELAAAEAAANAPAAAAADPEAGQAAEADQASESTSLLTHDQVWEAALGSSDRRQVGRQASNVGAQLQSVGRAAARNAGR